jgi:peptidoglycan/xylan/chitin deacetylase (PgdA/CDA1 family)
MHEAWDKLPLERERDLIARTTDALGDVLGAAPRGWRSPGGLTTTSTLALLHDAGYAYDSSFSDEDVPYLLEVAADRPDDDLVELPWTWPLDDAPFYGSSGTIRRPFAAAHQLTGYFMLVCHPRFTGRPARILALERLIERIGQAEGVWFARCDEIAAHARTLPTTPRYAAPAIAS